MSHHIIESVHIEGSPNFPDLPADFDADFTAIVGGTGAGKSSLLYMLLFVCNAPPPPTREARERYEAQIAATLGPGTVTAILRRSSGDRYGVTRKLGGAPRVHRLGTTGRELGDELADVSLTGELFDSEHYTPGEILALARDPVGQLALLDRFAQGAIARATDDVARVDRQLVHGDSAMRRLEAELVEDAAQTKDLPEVEELLATLQRAEGPNRAEIEAAHAANAVRGRERTAIASMSTELAAAQTALRALAREWTARVGGAVVTEHERGANGVVFARANAAAQRASAAIEEGARRIHDEIAASERAIEEEARALAAAHGAAAGAYHALLAASEADAARAAERSRVQAKSEALQNAKRIEVDHRRALDAMKRERVALLAERARLLLHRWTTRVEAVNAAKSAIGDYIDIEITHSGGTKAFEDLLVKLMHGSHEKEDLIKNIANGILPADLVAAVEADDPDRVMAVDDMKTDKAERARRFMKFLRKTGRMRELETVPLADVPAIRLKVGDVFVASGDLSTGQACTCILAILFARRAGPLVIDQPEDHLDNRYVFKVLVPSLVALKGERQVIIVTHNPNLPMLGNAERVLMMAASGREGRIEHAGAVDELRALLEDWMEGGREAFLKRAERYGHKHVEAPSP